MSIINRMLQELDKRHATRDPGAPVLTDSDKLTQQARPVIEAELLAAARIRMFEAWLEGRRTALAVIEPGFEHPAHPVHGVPTHRH